MTNHQTTTDEPVVITEGLTKHFGDFVAVADFDLQVKEGSVVSLLGPNGAGKTTIVRMLATLSEPTSGTARVCGYDVVRDADKVRSVLSLTGQFAALEDNLTAQENLLLMARLRGYSKASSQRIVEGLIDRFDIGEFREKLIKSVSGGQRRRVDLAAFQVNAELMAAAKKSAVLLHCLPAHRGEDITDDVLDGPQSRVWREVYHRRSAMVGVLRWIKGES